MESPIIIIRESSKPLGVKYERNSKKVSWKIEFIV